jgi:Ca2+-transporting ATPase
MTSGNGKSLWHTVEAREVCSHFACDPEHGLTEEEAQLRLRRGGANELQEGVRRSLPRILVSQFSDFMILVLLLAALISGLIGDPQDAIVILVIVLLNAVIGALQEYRAERAVAALRLVLAATARVVRNGVTRTIPARELVTGDLVLLEAGNVVPADLRLTESMRLQTGEAALTGESLAVDKSEAALADARLPLGERSNMVWKGTQVTSGRGRGVVVATGMATEIGHIAALLRAQTGVKTPLQVRLARFGRQLALAILAICAIIFAAGVLRGESVMLMLLTAISLAVAAIPEALPAVVTISLAFGARKMSTHNALVRRLPAVETLGSVTYICTDKTGTLTQNQMTLETLLVDRRRVAMATAEGELSETLHWRLGQALALSNDVHEENGTLTGDPTEIAFYNGARELGIVKAELEEAQPRLAEIPFDSAHKCMVTLHEESDGAIAFLKGAPEAVLALCGSQLTTGGLVSLESKELETEAEHLAAEGHRVLALACRELPEGFGGDLEELLQGEFIFLALAGLIDPPRPEAAAAVAACRSAGIVPVMITGDHPGTARAIATRLGIERVDAQVVTGRELDELSDEVFAQRVKEVRVYARVTPEQKIRIVKALQANGEFVAMTGDGVNDAPALKRAAIGVAMGQKGTDVAREASDLVLLDDNFATIVEAVREGRRIFDNIRKFVKYTMTSNAGEIWTLFLAPFLGLPIPLLPIHILWINLVTDGLPGLALAAEPAERGVMRRPPRPPNESIFAHGMGAHMIWVGLLIGGLSILGQSWAYTGGHEHWQTVVFTVLTLAQLFHVLAIRSERESLFSIGILSNRLLLEAVLLTVVLQLAVIYLPFLNPLFRTQPLTGPELAVCFLLASLVLVAVEIEKMLIRAGWLYR